MPEPSATAPRSPLASGAVARESTVTQPRAAARSAQAAVLPSLPTPPLVAASVLAWTPGRSAIAPPRSAWTRYRIRLAGPGGVPVKKERCLLVTADETVEGFTDARGVASFVVSSAPDGVGATVGADDADAARVPQLLLPDVLEEFIDLPGEDDPLELKRIVAPEFGYRKGDRAAHPVVTLASGDMDLRVGTLMEQQKFEHFRWSYMSHQARFGSISSGAFNAQPPRWRWTSGASCNQHVDFFLSYWFNYNGAFTPKASATDAASIFMLDCAPDAFDCHGKQRAHRGFAPFLEPVTAFRAATVHAPYDDKTYPGRAYNGTPLLDANGKPIGGRKVWPEYFLKYVRRSQFLDYDTMALTDLGRDFVKALANFNVYSVAEYYGTKGGGERRRAAGLDAMRGWLKSNRALAHLQRYTTRRGKASVALAAMTDAEIDALPEALLWQVAWRLDDEQPADRTLLAKLRTHLNVDHHAGVLVKRGAGNVPYAGTGPVELYKFSADGSNKNRKPIVMRRFFPSTPADRDAHLFTHYAFFRLRRLRDGGLAPNDETTAAAVAKQIDLDALPRFIHWT